MPRTLFFNNIEYTANDFVDLFKGLTNNGIRSADDLKVTASVPNSLTVDIAPGKLFLNGYFITFDTTTNIPITANTSGYNRKDRICVKLDTNNQTSSIVAVEGVPSSSPVSPNVPAVDGELYSTIAIVTVGNNVNSITQDNIYDARIVTKIWDDYNSTFNKSDNGYIKFPNGLILQWGTSSITFTNQYRASVMITYPIKFPNKIFNVSCTSNTSTDLYGMAGYSNRLNEFQAWLVHNNYQVAIANGSYELKWFSVGY